LKKRGSRKDAKAQSKKGIVVAVFLKNFASLRDTFFETTNIQQPSIVPAFTHSVLSELFTLPF